MVQTVATGALFGLTLSCAERCPRSGSAFALPMCVTIPPTGPPLCPRCRAVAHIIVVRDHLVFYGCDACGTQGAFSLPENASASRNPEKEKGLKGTEKR